MLEKLQFLCFGVLCGSSVLALNPYSDPACPVPPKQCPNINVTFVLRTYVTQNRPMPLNVSNPDSIANAQFTPFGEIKILIHGLDGSVQTQPNKDLIPAYFNRSKSYNIISLDYRNLGRCRVQATENIDLVANCTAQLMRALLPYQAQKKIDICGSHIIGLSLGVLVASNITKFLKECRLYRVTGLDPTCRFPAEFQIRPGIAQFVDCVHTDGFFYGYFYPVCDFDAYANGGFSQPACANHTAKACSHLSAVTYFAESINTKTGFYCTEYSFYDYLNGIMMAQFPVCQLFGEYVNRSARGTCFFATNAHSPYAQGKPAVCQSSESRSGSMCVTCNYKIMCPTFMTLFAATVLKLVL